MRIIHPGAISCGAEKCVRNVEAIDRTYHPFRGLQLWCRETCLYWVGDVRLSPSVASNTS